MAGPLPVREAHCLSQHARSRQLVNACAAGRVQSNFYTVCAWMCGSRMRGLETVQTFTCSES
eukprot:13318366-Alexandrium_andersonii.AAC.1